MVLYVDVQQVVSGKLSVMSSVLKESYIESTVDFKIIA